MSHYNSYGKQPVRKYSNEQPSFLNRKRQEHESDHVSKKHYEYEEKYDHYDHYDHYERYQPHQTKYYNLIREYPSPYYHNTSKPPNNHMKDYFYPSKSYHNGYPNKSPHRDHKKTFQKYTNIENEGIRNLSHCEMPSSPFKKKESGINNLGNMVGGTMGNIVGNSMCGPLNQSPNHKKEDNILPTLQPMSPIGAIVNNVNVNNVHTVNNVNVSSVHGLNMSNLGGVHNVNATMNSVNSVNSSMDHSSYQPRNITYQNQQNINIKINVTSPGLNSALSNGTNNGSNSSSSTSSRKRSSMQYCVPPQNIQAICDPVRQNELNPGYQNCSNRNIKSKKDHQEKVQKGIQGNDIKNKVKSAQTNLNMNLSLENTNTNTNTSNNSNVKPSASKDKDLVEDFDLLHNCPIAKPQKFEDVPPFDRNSIHIEKNIFDYDTFNPFPSMEFVPMSQSSFDEALLAHNNGLEKNKIQIDSCYLLSKIPNWNIVNLFVPPQNLVKEKFNDIPITDECRGKEKFYIVYDEKFEKEVDKLKEDTKDAVNKNKNDILITKQNLEHSSYDIRKQKFKILTNNYQIEQCNIQIDSINAALDKNLKDLGPRFQGSEL